MGISQIMSGWSATETPDDKDVTEEERLLTLFWNRAELKKEFSNLRHDRDHLIERLQEQEKKTEGVKKQLRNMEKMLADPEAGFKAIVYFQLRALWRLSNKQLAKFSEQLKKQQQDRERKRQIMEFNQARQKRLGDLSARIVSVKAEVDDMKNVLAGHERKRDSLKGFWNYFKRREIQATVDEHKVRLAGIRVRLEELFDRRIKVESEPWPDYAGLGIDGKRAINLALIALAQQLFVQLSDSKIALIARSANIKKVEDVNYGGRTDCDFMMKKISELSALMLSDRSYADELRARTEMLRGQVSYKSKSDTVPDAESVAKLATSVPGFTSGRGVSAVPLDINILTDDYWDLQKLLMK
ncbi:MAG: hypothetical protein HKM98_05070 [Gammaproteobacteria bacterium]|nr:hypothetical protein [Gammaproteobacteria bacterium]